RALARLLDQARRPAMNIGALVDMLDVDTADGVEVKQTTQRIREELATLGDAVTVASDDVTAQQRLPWPRQSSRIREIFASVNPDLALLPTGSDARLAVKCDVFFFSELLRRLTALIAEDAERSGPVWTLNAADVGALQLSLSWDGKGFPQAQLDALLGTSLCDAYGGYTVGDVLSAHESDIFIDGRNRLTLDVPRGEEMAERPQTTLRDYFDFSAHGASQAGRLSDLSFVVFDTETTGLDTALDDVVQIAGVRILRGSVVKGEVFDTLVNPGRKIPVGSTKIHGITDAMVAGAPKFSDVGGEFAEFAEDTVLVAHNAAFDRAFLDRLPAMGGPVFAQPMLCTAQLSLALTPHLNDHTLDAVAERYGVQIHGPDRHTAMGDAKATAEVFLKMLPILSERNVDTLPDALEFQRAI
ncbi:MAG: 3'-5' exonuclease, partial [Pseudomonadota bacterium]